jgi:hypothetical protein
MTTWLATIVLTIVWPVLHNVQVTSSSDLPKSYLSRLFSPENLPNIGLLFAGIAGILLTLRTLKVIGRQTTATEIAASAAKSSASAASDSALAVTTQNALLRDTAQRQLRAYICVTGGLLKFLRPEVPEVQIHLKNAGQTPAYDVRGWIHMWIEAYPLTVDLPEAPRLSEHP